MVSSSSIQCAGARRHLDHEYRAAGIANGRLMTDTSGRGCCEVVWKGFDEECSFRQRRTLWNSLEAVEVGQEASEEGEDEEQVDKGHECSI